jgi:hypothetical protein
VTEQEKVEAAIEQIREGIERIPRVGAFEGVKWCVLTLGILSAELRRMAKIIDEKETE